MQAAITTEEASFWSFAVALIVTGLGAALLFVPLSIAVLGATTPAEGPKASAFVNLSTQLGGSIAVAGLDVLIDQRWTFHSEVLGAGENLANPAVHDFLQRGSAAQLGALVNGQAVILAYADATLAIALVCIVCAPLIFFMRKPKAPAGPIEMGG
jgi:DHA2 family multidrug resistance protein